ncbi:MAG: hypothetical protein ACO38W_09080, partial [Phycisphaerales bacterium]
VFSEIAESLESLPTGGGEPAPLIQQELQAAMSSFSQRPLGTPNAGGRVADESVGSATASAGGPPFASPEALLAFLQRGGVADGNAATMEQVFRATSPAGRRMLKATLAIAQAAQPVAAAMMETFGESSGLDRLGGGAMPGMESARMVSSDGSQATIEVDGQELTLISEDGGWFADFDSMLPAGDPTQMAMQAGMLEGMAKQMGTFFSMFAQRIRDGEFASAEEAGGAMQQEMMAAMMGAAGGSR